MQLIYLARLSLLGLLIFPMLQTAWAEELEFVTYYPASVADTQEGRFDQISVGSLYRSSTLTDGQALIRDQVGVGTDNPQGALHVVGVNDQADKIIFARGTGNAAKISLGIDTANPAASLDVAGSRGSTGDRNFKVTYPNGGDLTNTEFSALTHEQSVVDGNRWTALYAQQGNAARAGTFKGSVLVDGGLDIKGRRGNTNSRNFTVNYPSGGDLTNTELSALVHNLPSVGGNGWTALYAKQGSAARAGTFDGNVLINGTAGGVGSRNFKVIYPGGGQLTNAEFSALTHDVASAGGNGWTALYAKAGNARRAGVFEGDVNVIGRIEHDGLDGPASSIKVKKDIERLHSANYQQILKHLNETPMIRFRYKKESSTAKKHLGIIAEEAPAEVLTKDGDQLDTINYISYALAAIKGQQEQIEALKQEVRDLQRENQSIRSALQTG